MIYTTDDFYPDNLKFFDHWKSVKEAHPELKLVVFTVANYNLSQRVDKDLGFLKWFDGNKDWCEVAVHGYDHMLPCEAERDDFEQCVEKALGILKPFMPKCYGYRSPGFHATIRMEPTLKRLGFGYIAYEQFIKYFDGRPAEPVFNTHCCDKWHNPITKIWRELCERAL